MKRAKAMFTVRYRRQALLWGCLLSGLLYTPVWADQQTTTAPSSNGTQAVSATARLDFTLNIGKFLFFRVGTGAYPTASSTVDTVTFNTTPTIPAGAVTPASGNNTGINWNGAAPTFSVTTSSNTVLPVEVRSNAGQISLRATATTPLTSGANTIPMSQIVVTSNDSNLPAPLIPDSGLGAAVNVVGTSFSNLVTTRNANWTFAYNLLTNPAAGTYNGQITFTASSP